MHTNMINLSAYNQPIATIYHTDTPHTYIALTGSSDDDEGDSQSTAAVVVEVIGSITGALIILRCASGCCASSG